MDVVSRWSTPAPAKNNTIAFSSNKNITVIITITSPKRAFMRHKYK